MKRSRKKPSTLPLDLRECKYRSEEELRRNGNWKERTSIVWPVLAVIGLPEYVDSAPWIGRSDEGGRLRVGSTVNCEVICALDGAGVANLTDGRVWDGIPSSNGALVCLAIDGNLADNPVGLDEREKHERHEGENGKEESCGLHCSWNKRSPLENAFALKRETKKSRRRKEREGRRKGNGEQRAWLCGFYT